MTIRALELPDWLVMSGAVYQRVLNALTERVPDYGVRDYDLGYFDASDISYEAEDAVIRRVAAAFDEPLRSVVEVRNQARVRVWFEGHFGGSWYHIVIVHSRSTGTLRLADVRGRRAVEA